MINNLTQTVSGVFEEKKKRSHHIGYHVERRNIHKSGGGRDSDDTMSGTKFTLHHLKIVN